MPEYVIRNADGKEVRREETPNDVIGPNLAIGETAEPATTEKKKQAPKRAADSDKP